jgi:hypothetical protein
MSNLFKKIILWFYIKIHSIFINISIALYNTEQEILKADPNDIQERDKRIQRKLHRNPLLEKFYAGQRDEKYVKDYYELLKKADKFMRTSTPRQIAIAADKHLRFEGQDYSNDNVLEVKDKYGRRYSHYGFFDEKHKHAGKTLGEVFELEKQERRTNDDDYELLYIFTNKPIEVGLADIMDIVQETDKENVDHEFEVMDIWKKSRTFKFPIKAYREDENVVNKIEELTEYLHVKKIGFEYRQLEFFIPLQFKTEEIEENSPIFNEITNIKSIFVKNDYGELVAFGINKLIKRIRYKDTHEVWKFEGIEMETMSIK